MLKSLYNLIFCKILDLYFNIFERNLLTYLRKKSLKRKQNDLVSVCIPTHNRSKILLDRALPSVLRQSHKNLEIIIVGDCCTDDTEEKLKKISDDRVQFYNLKYKKNNVFRRKDVLWFSGAVKARNFAFEKSKGNWIAILDDDEIWTDDHVEKLLNFCVNNNFEFASGFVEVPGRKPNPPKLISDYFKNSKLLNKFKINPFLGGHSSFFFISYLKKFKYNENCWRRKHNRVHDIDLALRFLNSGVRIGYLKDKVGINFPRPGEKYIGYKAAKEHGYFEAE